MEIFTGTPPFDASAIACLDICDLDDTPLLPTTTELDPQPRQRAWM